MKALVLAVLFGFVLTVSLGNPINQQDAAPDSLRDVADDLEPYNPERQVSLNGRFGIDDPFILITTKGYS